MTASIEPCDLRRPRPIKASLTYSLRIKRTAAKEIEALSRQTPQTRRCQIASLANDARPAGSERLSGEEKYRLRQGGYRILYEIVDSELVVTVVQVGNRRDVYR